MPQLKLLFLLDWLGPVSMSEIAARLRIGLSAATGVVDRLEEQGLAHRESDPRDRRVVRVSGTEASRRLLTDLRPYESEQLDQILDQVSLADLECCARAFGAIQAAAARVAAGSPDRERVSRPTELPAGGAAKEAR
jgi:DNA-binding MarR family transcriptional regulator